MDTVTPDARRQRLRQEVEAAQRQLRNAAQSAHLKGDPAADQMQALSLSLGAHYDMFCAAETAQAALAQSVAAHTDAVTKGVLDTVKSSLNGMTAALGPELLKNALPTMQSTLRFIKYRTIYWMLLAMVTLVIISGMFSYAVGLNHGRTEGQAAAQTVQDAMKAGPDAAMDWALLMANNNPGPELAMCKKTLSTDEYGRRSCSMPIWLDPPVDAPQ